MTKKNLHDLNKELNELLDEIEYTQINEQSLAWDYRNKKQSLCAWTEGPMKADNRYFKVYNNESPDQATKVARIRIDRSVYVGGNHRERNSKGKVEKWYLSKREKELLVSILKSNSIDNEGCTKWQDILIRWNRDNFGIPAKNTINGNIEGFQARPGLLEMLKPFPIDYPMPDYLSL